MMSNSTFLKKNVITAIGLWLTLLAGNISFAQNGIIGTGFGTNNWLTIDNFSAGAGSSRIFTATPNGAGNQFFRLVRNSGGNFTQFGPFGCVDTEWNNPGVVYGMSVCSNGAFFINCPNATDKYVFKTPNEGTAVDLLYFRVQGAVRNVSTVTQSPLAASVTECRATTVTATLDEALAVGQAVYMRYTKNGYAASTVVKLSGLGTTYTAKIPSDFNTAEAIVSYYVFTSGDSGVASDGSNADLYSINFNNNGGFNYSYVVAAGGATTYIPDDNFEQELINLGLDCTLDNYVFTSNISNVTLLDIRDKNITNLIGIKDFTNLERLYCNNETLGDGNDNAITDLDVSGMTYLRHFYCQNNEITALNINGLPNLEALDTSNNPFLITTLDVHLFPNLYYLICQNNGLTNLDISGLTNLETLIVWDNSLTSIDLSANPKIKYLDCDDNAFTSLNVSALTNLNQFYCSGNSLSSLDVRGLSNLANFACTDNPSLTCILVDDVNAANTAISTIDTDSNTPFWAKDAGATYSYCDCSLPIIWDGITWSNVVGPTSITAAVIAGNYNVSANINACTLTVNNNAIVTIPSGYNVTLNAPLTVSSGSFTLGNNANLIQSTNVANSGNINVKRSSNSLYRLDYTIWSSPVASQNLAAFSPLTSQSPSRFYTYDSATNLYDNTINPTTTAFAKAKGYLIRMPNTDPTSGYDAGTASLNFAGVFTGVPNTGNVPVNLNYIDATHGYNMVGNPYPSTIDANAFITANTSKIESTLYFWRKRNGSGSAYAAYNPAGGTSTYASTTSEVPNGTIQVGQGFFVQAKGPATVAAFFTNAMRTANTVNQFFKTKNGVEKNRIWLNLTNSTGVFSQALVAYITDATQGVDVFDGAYINDSPVALTSNIKNEDYTIQGRALPFDPSDVVALNFKTDVAGDYTIGLDHVDGLFSGSQDVFLKDNVTGVETDLKTGSYTFTSAAGVDNARFSLKYQRNLGVNAATFNESSVAVYKNKGILHINAGSTTINNIKVFDIQGRLIAEQKNVKANSATIKDLKATKQVLIVKITSQENTVVNKKVVN